MITYSLPSLGLPVYGKGAMGSPVTVTYDYEYPTYEGWRTAALGRCAFGEIGFGESYPLEVQERSVEGYGGFAFVSFSSYNGSLLGRIRTDVQHTIVQKLEFSWNSHGCAEFTLTLNALPGFPIQPSTVVSVNVFNTPFNWFTGVVREVPGYGDGNGPYVIKGVGNYKLLENLTAEQTFEAPQDIGEIVQTIVEEEIVGYAPVVYDTGRIDTDTGVLTASDIEFSSADLTKIFDNLADMANCRWGVDGDAKFFFEQRNGEPLRVFFMEHHAGSFKVEENPDTVKNSIKISRQQGKGSGGAGWVVALIVNDETSIALYGLQKWDYQVQGYFSDADCEIIANALLEEYKDPKTYVTMTDVPIRSSDDFLWPGTYRFISGLTTEQQTVNECDRLADWIIEQDLSSSDLTVAEDDQFVFSGAKSIRLTWSRGIGDIIRTSVAATGRLTAVRFAVRSDAPGALLEFGFGYGSWVQNRKVVPVNLANTWVPFVWDIAGLGIDRVNEIGFRILGNPTGAVNIWIDRIQFDVMAGKHVDAELTTVQYVFSPDGIVIKSAEFGPPPARMDNFVAQLQARVEENRIVSEIR